jgi:hypothetical protein
VKEIVLFVRVVVRLVAFDVFPISVMLEPSSLHSLKYTNSNPVDIVDVLLPLICIEIVEPLAIVWAISGELMYEAQIIFCGEVVVLDPDVWLAATKSNEYSVLLCLSIKYPAPGVIVHAALIAGVMGAVVDLSK